MLSSEISRIHAEHFSVYGVRKAWRVLRREGITVGRDRVARLMRGLGLAGATRTRRIRTTHPAAISQRPADLVERVFTAAGPNRLWVASLPSTSYLPEAQRSGRPITAYQTSCPKNIAERM